MTPLRLVRQSLVHYWRTNAAVVAGVAVAVTVLSGALLVGDSVRASLSDLIIRRLGRTDLAVLSKEYFRARLADDVREASDFNSQFADVTPLIATDGAATDQGSGRRAPRIKVYGVDDRFWRFHGHEPPISPSGSTEPSDRTAFISAALARDIGATTGNTLLVRVQRPSGIPLESLHGRKDDVGRTLRLIVGGVLGADELGEFSLQPQQAEVRAVFVQLPLLQRELGVPDRVNVLLVSAHPSTGGESTRTLKLQELLRQRAQLEDVGLTLRSLAPQNLLSLEADGSVIDEAKEAAAVRAARTIDTTPSPILTYLVNAIRLEGREIPYSLVSGLELDTIVPGLDIEEPPLPPIVLNQWAAKELAATVGSRVTLDYFVWEEPGRLVAQSENFLVAAVVPIEGAAADPDLAPLFPGITDSRTLRDWDPPFPFELGRIRPIDEEYWERYRTTPKAFVPLNVARSLWRSRFGSSTSVRVATRSAASLTNARDEYVTALRAAIDPVTTNLAVRDVRTDGLAASQGATDFGEYFTYFSFFLVASAVMLAALFFKLGVEQRGREIGLLESVGWNARAVRRLFLAEATVLAIAGSAIGLLGALGYGALIMTGLRTWWIGAVGTTALSLHITGRSLAAGAAGGIGAALVCIWWTLRSLTRMSERQLLAGDLARQEPSGPAGTQRGRSVTLATALVLFAMAAVLLGAGATAMIGRAGAFFGAGASLLIGCMFLLSYWLKRPASASLVGRGWWPVSRLGLRYTSYRPARSVLSVAVIASATFILISVDAFRKDTAGDLTDRRSGTGGYSLIVDTLLPIVNDPNDPEGRDLLGLSTADSVTATPFRVLPGDDASCLNLYLPRQPRVFGVPDSIVTEGRFVFQDSLAQSDEERANPWLLLDRLESDGAIPIVADANSMTYVLHRKLGDEITFDRAGRQIRLRLVAALADSIFQGEVLMSEENFVRQFPDVEGYSLLLVDSPLERATEIASVLEDRLADFGAAVTPTGTRLAEFHQVENTYLSTFQALGGLGLLLGTVGLAAVLLRNVLERRRELALLSAVGYGRTHIFAIIIAESTFLLACGLIAGAVCALIAIAPAAIDRGGQLPAATGAGLLLFAVFATGLVSAIIATRTAVQSRLLDALRSE